MTPRHTYLLTNVSHYVIKQTPRKIEYYRENFSSIKQF